MFGTGFLRFVVICELLVQCYRSVHPRLHNDARTSWTCRTCGIDRIVTEITHGARLTYHFSNVRS